MLVLAGGLAARALRRLALAGGVEPRDPEERGVRHGCEGVQDKGRRAGGCGRGTRVQDHGRCVEGKPQTRTMFFILNLCLSPPSGWVHIKLNLTTHIAIYVSCLNSKSVV